MKATSNFRKQIAEFIESEKKADELFCKCVDEQPEKTIDGCVNYILKTVRESNVCGWTDTEVYCMAKHFFDEKELKDPGEMAARVVVNYHVELSEEEKAQAKENAMRKVENEERRKIEEAKKREEERRKKREEARAAALAEKRAQEERMQLDLFAM